MGGLVQVDRCGSGGYPCLETENQPLAGSQSTMSNRCFAIVVVIIREEDRP
jgi:hypothetical protein